VWRLPLAGDLMAKFTSLNDLSMGGAASFRLTSRFDLGSLELWPDAQLTEPWLR
jgi:hypothetical protein